MFSFSLHCKVLIDIVKWYSVFHFIHYNYIITLYDTLCQVITLLDTYTPLNLNSRTQIKRVSKGTYTRNSKALSLYISWQILMPLSGVIPSTSTILPLGSFPAVNIIAFSLLFFTHTYGLAFHVLHSPRHTVDPSARTERTRRANRPTVS